MGDSLLVRLRVSCLFAGTREQPVLPQIFPISPPIYHAAGLPGVGAISPHLPHISPYLDNPKASAPLDAEDLPRSLRRSPHISPYLPISPQMRGLFRRRGTPSRSGRRTASQTPRGRWAGRPSPSRRRRRRAATSARSRGCVPASAGHYVVISSPLRVVGRSTVRGGWLVWSYREALSLSLSMALYN